MSDYAPLNGRLIPLRKMAILDAYPSTYPNGLLLTHQVGNSAPAYAAFAVVGEPNLGYQPLLNHIFAQSPM